MSDQPELCPCGHILKMCHRENAARWCPPNAHAEQLRELREAAMLVFSDARITPLRDVLREQGLEPYFPAARGGTTE